MFKTGLDTEAWLALMGKITSRTLNDAVCIGYDMTPPKCLFYNMQKEGLTKNSGLDTTAWLLRLELAVIWLQYFLNYHTLTYHN